MTAQQRPRRTEDQSQRLRSPLHPVVPAADPEKTGSFQGTAVPLRPDPVPGQQVADRIGDEGRVDSACSRASRTGPMTSATSPGTPSSTPAPDISTSTQVASGSVEARRRRAETGPATWCSQLVTELLNQSPDFTPASGSATTSSTSPRGRSSSTIQSSAGSPRIPGHASRRHRRPDHDDVSRCSRQPRADCVPHARPPSATG